MATFCIVAAMKQATDIVLLSEAREAARSGRGLRVRRAAGLSQPEVADFCGVSRACIARWEHGDRRPRGAAALRWIRLLRTLEDTRDGR